MIQVKKSGMTHSTCLSCADGADETLPLYALKISMPYTNSTNVTILCEKCVETMIELASHALHSTYSSIEEIVDANSSIGQTWFGEAESFFGSIIYEEVYGGRYFVTSEQDTSATPAWGGERRWSIRACNDGRISTVGEFGAYGSLEEAQEAARCL